MTTCAAPDARTVTNDRQRVTGLLVLHMQRHPFVYPPQGAHAKRTFYSLRSEADSVLAGSELFLRLSRSITYRKGMRAVGAEEDVRRRSKQI
ncbi:hypothetical protein Zmor_020994 [Zophobas morio]|uniref:Uncharacterized protein n=1 Tax=Zophobas morio TaxID=2755281 RepID=A0AA38I6R6_9CUCU|nr:hypothetical protein Zmor_020994 [Zophobas morio]